MYAYMPVGHPLGYLRISQTPQFSAPNGLHMLGQLNAMQQQEPSESLNLVSLVHPPPRSA